MLEMTAATPQLLRRFNAASVLDVVRGADVVTITELIQATGLTRATAISVCEELVGRGWIRELENQRDFGDYQKGRPARRFALDDRAGYVLGIDVGAFKTTVVAADLRGRTVGRRSLPFPALEITPEQRINVINQAIQEALAAAGATSGQVLAATAGLAAPVDRHGTILASQHFWAQFDVGLKSALQQHHGWTVQLENDANLAALGERWRGSAVGVEDLVVILASERLGSGVLESGRLLHGNSGGAGEMAYLDLVEGVGTTDGIASLARLWAAEALAGTKKTVLRASGEARDVGAEEVFAAAAAGDQVAQEILDRIAERLAKIVATVATMFNPELVVLGGAVADSAGVLLDPVRARLRDYTATPPRLAVSPLSDSIVTVGAVRHALDFVETHSLDLELASAASAG